MTRQPYAMNLFLDALIKNDEQAQVDNSGQTSPIQRDPIPPGDGPDERYPTSDIVLNPSGRQLHVAVANTPAARAMGLQGLGEDMDGFDGMLFSYPSDARASFHPANVPYPVHVSWWDSSGAYVDHAGLVPGGPAVSPAGPHRHALELAASDAEGYGIGPDTSLAIPDDGDGTIPMDDRP